MNIFLLMLVGFLGIGISIIVRIRNAKKASKNLTLNVTAQKYLLDEWLSILLSMIGVIVAGILLDSNVTDYISSKFQNWTGLILKVLFITIGYSGSDLLLKFLSVTQKAINSEVDKMAIKANNDNNTPN